MGVIWLLLSLLLASAAAGAEELTVQLMVFPPAARVLQDGRLLGTCEQPVRIVLSPHNPDVDLMLQLGGYRDKSLHINMAASALAGGVYPRQGRERLDPLMPVVVDAWYLARAHLPLSLSLLGLGTLGALTWRRRRPAANPPSPDDVLSDGPVFEGLELDDVKLGDSIGQGGAAEVYVGTPTSDRYGVDKLAVKILRSDTCEDVEFKRRFQREIKICQRLQHPNIVRVLGVGSYQGRIYLVMEYLRGESLKTRLQRGPLSTAEVRQLLGPLCDAVAYAHDEGVIHRDLTPGNIWLTDDGQVRVLDFGIARHEDYSRVTSTGMTIGTPEYIAPEQLMGDEPQPAADQYSLGCVLYQSLTGHLPFEARDRMAAALMRLHHAPTDPRRHGPMDDELAGVLLRMLERDPAARWDSVRAAAAALDAALAASHA